MQYDVQGNMCANKSKGRKQFVTDISRYQILWLLLFSVVRRGPMHGTFLQDVVNKTKVGHYFPFSCQFSFCWQLSVPLSAKGLLVGCLTSQQHASLSQGRIFSDNFTCCHTDKSCRPNFPSHPVIVYWHWANQSQHWPYNARCLAGYWSANF